VRDENEIYNGKPSGKSRLRYLAAKWSATVKMIESTRMG
jgi:hypothetical protein